jgi:farnesyl-diphosphate farnesyltransferase
MVRGETSMNLRKDALETLKQTSRTFYIPIHGLPDQLREAVASAYLCMRAIDEIEDHPQIPLKIKAKLLQNISLTLQSATQKTTQENLSVFWDGQEAQLEEVSLRIVEWALLAPDSIAPRIWDATAAMADRMAYWALKNWEIHTVKELDTYTFSVAGAVGLLLSDLWAWYDNTQTNRLQAIGFGRGLQAVNIARNYKEDLERGVNFLPDGWNGAMIREYARQNLELGDLYTKSLPKGPALDFCRIPLTLAHGTLKVLSLGQEKLSRADVMALIEKATQDDYVTA